MKVSEEDLEWLEPGAEPVAAARRLLARDAAAALLTRGAFACRVAALTCSRAGADPPRRGELRAHQ